MIICLEGVDATGKSTLARLLGKTFGLTVQLSEGPPQYPGEMNVRLEHYSTMDNVIFDRHPVVSQPIYAKLRPNSPEPIDPRWIEEFYDSKPIFIYCDPLERGLTGHRRRSTVDTDEHIAQIDRCYEQLIADYREWARYHAFLWYRIGDDTKRLINAIEGVLYAAAL